MTRRWYLLDGDIVGNGFRALCYEGDELVECESFRDRWAAMEHGEHFVHDGEVNDRDYAR